MQTRTEEQGGHASVEAAHATVHRTRAIDHAATTARGRSPPGAGGRADGGADGCAGSPREPQHADIHGRGRAVACRVKTFSNLLFKLPLPTPSCF